jgi:hypothetical protein
VTLPEVSKIPSLLDFDRLFSHAERATSLLDRCRPANASAEMDRLASRWEAGEPALPDWRYAPKPDLAALLDVLEEAAKHPPIDGPIGELYARRAGELFREAAIVDALGTPEFRRRAAARFTIDASEHGEQAARWALEWSRLAPPAEPLRVRSDDEDDPRSLFSTLSALVGKLRLPVRITKTDAISSSAAAGDGFVVIREGLWHSPHSAQRIAAHEIYGHVLPRHRARDESLGLFAVGTCGASDDEEGRALLIEDREGLFDDGRRRELGVRHCMAAAVFGGADWVDAVRIGLEHGIAARHAVAMATRVHRGGGLARELVYLPALSRVRAAFESDPSLEEWLSRGRIAVSAARVLARFFAQSESVQANVATTGV